MKHRLDSSFLADRGARFAQVGAYPLASSHVAKPAAPAVNPSPAGAAFSRFTETCPVAPVDGQATGRSAAPTPAGRPVTLSEASAFILSLIAAHEGRSERDVLAEMIAAAGKAIGLSALLSRDAEGIDLAELPGFARAAANRFRGGGP
ncbi:hypothetical protein [Mesorhizobium sp.]|uniref:hypothetical protein n=1 Tax=Mesorhizobium sp. TaxID=1871066 RepID=UPI003BAA694A